MLLVNVLPTTASACLVVTADEAVRGGKTIALKSIVDEAVQDCQCVQRVLVSRRTGADVAMTQRDIQLEKVSLTLHRTTAKLTHTHTHCRRCLKCQTRVSLSLWIVRILCSCSTPQAPLASQRASSTLRLATSSMPPSHNRSPSTQLPLSLSHTNTTTHTLYCSMCLTIDLEMCMRVWLTLVGSLVTHMLCMVLSAMEPPLSSLSPTQPTLILVSVQSTMFNVRHTLI